MDPKHPLATDGRTAFSRFRVKGLDEGAEFFPGNDPLHFREELFPPRRFLVFFEGGGIRECPLAVHRSSSPRAHWSAKRFLLRYFTGTNGYMPVTFSEIPQS